MRRASKVDANQADLVEEIRAHGYSVLHLHKVGEGCPDILVGKHGVNTLLEIKDGNKVPSRRKKTIAQIKFHDEWRGQAAVVKNITEALAELRKPDD